jgi:hypothetical protein
VHLRVEGLGSSKISNDRRCRLRSAFGWSLLPFCATSICVLSSLFAEDFFLARSSYLAIFFSLSFATSIVRMTLFSVLDIAPSGHWTANNAKTNEPGSGAGGFAASDPSLGRRESSRFVLVSKRRHRCAIGAISAACEPRFSLLQRRSSERGRSYDLPALRRHRPGEQTSLRRVRIADALEAVHAGV